LGSGINSEGKINGELNRKIQNSSRFYEFYMEQEDPQNNTKNNI
jgi:hypothetical protein